MTFSVPIQKEAKKLVRMERKLQKSYLADYNLLIVQDLWQAHY